jgi:proline iminopeptidase
MKQAVTGGVRLAYWRQGSGLPLLCLHGGMGIDSASLRVPGLLSLSKEGVDLVVFDQRGHGASDRPPAATYTHQQWATDARLLARELGWSRYALLGHSYGGFIALEHAVRWPQPVTHLILVASSAGPLSLPPLTFRSEAELRAYFQKNWPRFFAKADKHWELFDALQFSLDPFNAAFGHELPRYDLRDRMRDLALPTLLIVGSQDPYLAHMERLAGQLPQASLRVYDGVGHFPFIETPAAFREAVTTFLAQ